MGQSAETPLDVTSARAIAHERGAGLGDEHQPPPIVRIGHDAGEHREGDDRHDPHEPDHAERQPLAIRRRQQRDMPQQRRVLHVRAGEREQEPDPEQAEVAMLERDQ